MAWNYCLPMSSWELDLCFPRQQILLLRNAFISEFPGAPGTPWPGLPPLLILGKNHRNSMLFYRSYTEHPVSSIPECKSPRYGTHSSISWPEAMAISPALLGIHPILGSQSPSQDNHFYITMVGHYSPHWKQLFVVLTIVVPKSWYSPESPLNLREESYVL